MLVFFSNLSLIEFQVRYFALFLPFSVIDNFKWFWMGNLHNNIQLMLEFLKAPFLVLNFFYYTLMTFPTMLSVLLLSRLMILSSVLSVFMHLIYSFWTRIGFSFWIWPTRHADWGKKWLVDFNAAKLNWFHLIGLITVCIDVKMDQSILEVK